MQQKIFSAVCLLALCLFFNREPAVKAQSNTPKYEVGAQFSLVRFTDLDITEPGFGGRFTYNVNEHLAFEAEGNFFPRHVLAIDDLPLGGRKAQGLFGVKAGARNKRFGVFGKVRPGFVHFGNFGRPGFACVDPCSPPLPNFSETNLALDLGGVVELYPSRRTVVRFDLGDTIIHSGSGKVVGVPETFFFSHLGRIDGIGSLVRSTSHNLQFSVGVGFRF